MKQAQRASNAKLLGFFVALAGVLSFCYFIPLVPGAAYLVFLIALLLACPYLTLVSAFTGTEGSAWTLAIAMVTVECLLYSLILRYGWKKGKRAFVLTLVCLTAFHLLAIAGCLYWGPPLIWF
jgi:hypothetical protein